MAAVKLFVAVILIISALALANISTSTTVECLECDGEFCENVVAVAKNLLGMQKQITEIENNLVPIGFIYTQLPLQTAPVLLWPSFGWLDVTETYNGHFFRAFGGNSAHFETFQSDNTRRIVSVQTEMMKAGNENYNTNISDGGTSSWVWTGDDIRGPQPCLNTRFTSSGGEIRPMNVAVKIWKRVS